MKKLNFLVLGALATGLLATSAIASENEEVLKQNITNGLNTLIHEHQDKGFFKEKSSLDIQFVNKSKEVTADTPQNMASLIANACKVTLVFDEHGHSPKLASEESILKTTEFQNDKQKEIMREFIALHETFHCEFINIESPIKVEGKSNDFNNKLNYYLKEMYTVPVEGFGQIAYIDNLNENFADIAATGLLIKKYGENNADLKYVLNANKTQRHAQYFETSLSSHFTHIGLEKSLSEENINKLKNSTNADEFKEIALELANKSVQQLMTQRKDLTEEMFSEKAFYMGATVSLLRYMNYSLADENQKNKFQIETNWKNGITRGFHAQFSRKVVDEDVLKNSKLEFSTPGVDNVKILELVDYATKLIKEPKNEKKIVSEYNQFSKYMTEFKRVVYSVNDKKIDSFDDKTKEEIANKMLILRNRFLDSVGQNHTFKPN